ncbi:MAG: DUF302 domain-containing protein [Acidimicrobiales bacterium]
MKGITTTIDTTPDKAEELTRASLADEGFGVLTEIDVAATLAAKLGVERPALKILGACNPGFAHTAIEHDPSVALLLPCNVVIEQTPDGVTVTAVDPRALLDGVVGLDELAGDVAARLKRALDAVTAAAANTKELS